MFMCVNKFNKILKKFLDKISFFLLYLFYNLCINMKNSFKRYTIFCSVYIGSLKKNKHNTFISLTTLV